MSLFTLVLIWNVCENLQCTSLNKIIHFTEVESLIKNGKLLYLILTLGLGAFIKKCRVLTNVLGGQTSIFRVDAKARA